MKTMLDKIMRMHGVEPIALRGMGAPRLATQTAAAESTDLAEQEAIGQPGTLVRSGKVYAEPTPSYGPTYVRGTSGNHGIYEEHYRSEPLIFDAVQSHTETLVQGKVELQAPAEVDESTRSRVEEFVDFHGAQMSQWLTRYVEDAAHSCLIFGFAPFNAVWGGIGEGERTYLHDVRYYEPSTVDEWCFDDTLSRLVGAKFRTSGDGPAEWYVPAVGEQPQDHRLVLANLAARGNNVEGVSPLRPTIFYVLAKQLLLQISMVAAEKYGIPIAMVREVPVDGAASQTLETDAATIFSALKYQRAIDAHVAKMPAGLTIEFAGPSGQMPTYGDLIAYCDQMIAHPFSVEGSLLGMQSSVGSYALGEVKERDTLRSAPYYARRILAPLNEHIARVAAAELGSMVEYPRLVWRMDGATDQGARLTQMMELFGGPVSTWPKAAQAVALEQLDLPPDTFDRVEEEAPARPSLGLSECGHDHISLDDRTPGALELSEVDGLEAIMDEVEAALAVDLARIQREMQADWRTRIRDNRNTSDLLADRRAMRDEWEVVITEAVESAMRGAAEQAGAAYLDALGSDATYTLDMDAEIALLAAATIDETLGRIIGVMTQSEVERQRGGVAQTVAILSAGALAVIAARVTSSAINRARDSVVQGLVGRAREQGARIGRVVATRSAVLDSRTCKTCRQLDGRKATVGTAAYRALTPPNRCEGRERCRCVWTYDLPYESLANAGVISEQAAAERQALTAIQEDS